MPNEYSNFTTPDWQAKDGGRQGDGTNGAGDQGQVWNPSGGPDGQGAWKPAQPVRRACQPPLGRHRPQGPLSLSGAFRLAALQLQQDQSRNELACLAERKSR